MSLILPIYNFVTNAVPQGGGDKSAEVSGKIEKPTAYVTAEALGHYVAVESEPSALEKVVGGFRSAYNYVFGGSAACGIIAEKYIDKQQVANDGGVDGGDGGVCVDNEPPWSFSSSLPEDNATNVSLRPTFTWAPAGDPEGQSVTYTLMVDTDQNFTNPVTYDASDLSQYTLVNPLATDTTYYWKVEARDGCPNGVTESAPFSFTTLANCTTAPGAFDLVDPADTSDWVSLTPTLDWSDSIDVDPGDSVTYRLEIATDDQFTSPVVYDGLAQSNFTIPAGDALANGTTYYWRVTAEDDCQNTVSSTSVYSFTTEPACVPLSFLDTDFTAGSATGIAVFNGSITLPEDYAAWTGSYDADLLPDADGWTLNGVTNASASAGILTVNTLGSNGQGYYEINPGFVNATGSVIEARLKIDGEDDISPPSASGFSLWAADGIRRLAFTFYSNQVCEPLNSGTCQVTDTTSYHDYRLVFQNNDYMLYKDGALFLDGTGMSFSGASGLNYLQFGDTAANPDATASVDYIYYYNLGTVLPAVTSGTYLSAPIDSGLANYPYDGATIGWTPNNLPGEVSVAVRAANNIVDLSSQAWSSDLTNNPATLPIISGQYLQWMITLNAVTPTLPPVVDEVSGEKLCP